VITTEWTVKRRLGPEAYAVGASEHLLMSEGSEPIIGPGVVVLCGAECSEVAT
jgi:hypothetical protein